MNFQASAQARSFSIELRPRNEQLLADYERMQQQQQSSSQQEAGLCGDSSTCWGPEDIPPPGEIPPGGIEKVD